MTKTHIAIGKVSLKGMSERPEKCIPNDAHNHGMKNFSF